MTDSVLTTAAIIGLIPNGNNAVPRGVIGGITIDATIEEIHSESLEVTEHPVEFGAQITDHSYNRPSEVMLRCGWSNSSASASSTAIAQVFSSGSLSVDDYVSGIYSQLLALKEAAVPFSIVTTLKIYKNMLITALQTVRDSKTSQALMVTAVCREVIFVSTQSASLPPVAVQTFPLDTADVQNVGSVAVMPGSPSLGGAVSPIQWLPGAPSG